MPRGARFALLAASAVGALFSLYVVVHAHGLHGVHGFPIDDTWIHLTYARNLVEHGTFAYFPGDPTTSGSTSPLYTFAIAAVFACFGESKVVVYGFGIACQAAFLWVLGDWLFARTRSAFVAAAGVVLLGCSRHLGFLSVSGMETSMFLLLVAGVFRAFVAERWVVTGVLLGLSVWARTDGLVLAPVLWIAWLLRGTERGPESGHSASGRWRPLFGLGVPFVVFSAAYLAFNKVLGGTVLPTTYAGKTVYYADNSLASFLLQVWRCFSADGWAVLLPLAILGVILVAGQIVSRRASPLAAEAGLVVAWILAYAVMLRFGGRGDRYLVPALPVFVVLALGTLVVLARAIGGSVGKGVVGLVLLAAAVLQVPGAKLGRDQFARACDYHAKRHERVGNWLAANTPADAVIATHDIGAIAYYSGRRIVDLVGLVRPDVIEHLGKPGYTSFLVELLRETGVSYVATLRNWQEIDNAPPVFVADPNPEILEVFRYDPERHYFVPKAITERREYARNLLRRGQLPQALQHLRELVRLDPRSARNWAVLGNAAVQAGQFADAERALREALRRNPEHVRARANLAKALRGLGRPEAARKVERGG